MTICGKPAEKPQKRTNERLDFPPGKSIGKKMKNDHAHTLVPALSCVLGSPSPVHQCGQPWGEHPMAATGLFELICCV
jgi:hypothetical protein